MEYHYKLIIEERNMFNGIKERIGRIREHQPERTSRGERNRLKFQTLFLIGTVGVLAFAAAGVYSSIDQAKEALICVNNISYTFDEAYADEMPTLQEDLDSVGILERWAGREVQDGVLNKITEGDCELVVVNDTKMVSVELAEGLPDYLIPEAEIREYYTPGQLKIKTPEYWLRRQKSFLNFLIGIPAVLTIAAAGKALLNKFKNRQRNSPEEVSQARRLKRGGPGVVSKARQLKRRMSEPGQRVVRVEDLPVDKEAAKTNAAKRMPIDTSEVLGKLRTGEIKLETIQAIAQNMGRQGYYDEAGELMEILVAHRNESTIELPALDPR